MNAKRAILIGALFWLFIFVWWSIMIFIPGLQDLLWLQYIIHYVLLIVVAVLLTKWYYKKKDDINGFLLGLIFLIVGVILDLIITMNLFIIPQGMTHVEFFFSPWMLGGYALLILTVGIYDLVKNKKK